VVGRHLGHLIPVNYRQQAEALIETWIAVQNPDKYRNSVQSSDELEFVNQHIILNQLSKPMAGVSIEFATFR